MDRDEYLDAASTAWEELDPDQYPFIRAVAGQLRDHDDREQFLAGIPLILAGVTTIHALGDSPAKPATSAEPPARQPGQG